MACFLGIDLGLSGARAAVVDASGRLLGTGRVVTSARRDPTPEQDPGEWLDAIAHAVRAALSAAGDVRPAAVGVGAFGPCAVTLDAQLRPTGPASLFAFDSRHEPWRQRLIDSGLSNEAVAADHVVPKLMRIAETDPQRFADTAWVTDATGFVVAALTGVPAMDPITRLDHVLDGVPTVLPLAAPKPADTIAGQVTTAAAARFGIAAGTPVAIGSYDSYVDLFGAGVTAEGDAGMLLGSTAVIGRVCRRLPELGALRATPLIGEGHMVGGWTSTSGSLLSWADDVLRADAGEAGRPGSTGLIMLPYFAGERAPVWDARARGAMLGLTLSTTGRDIRQSATEAVALSIMDIVARMDAAIGPARSFRVAGGGAAIRTLTQAIASATGAELEIVAHPGEAVAGAMLAARAVGAAIERPVAEVVRPDPRASDCYAELMDIYRPLYGQLAGAMHKLAAMAEREGAR